MADPNKRDPRGRWTVLMKAVTAAVGTNGDSKPGVAVKAVLMIGKPVPKD